VTAAIPTAEAEAGARRSRRNTIGWHLVLGAVTVVAAVVLARRMGAADLGTRLQAAQPDWVAVAIGLSALPILGSTITLIALTPGRLPFWRTMAVQLATSFVNVVTPASAGGLALNVRYLHRRHVPAAAAVAVVGIVQTTAVLVTAVLVLGLLLIAGRAVEVPGHVSTSVLIVVAGIVLALAIALRLWTAGRVWLARNVLAPARSAWPQLRATLASPGRLAAAVAGHLTVTLGFAGTLGAAVQAFGGSGSLLLLILVVVGSSAVAGAVPVPGGIGAAEAALLAGLVTVVGVEAPIALSAVLLYRLVTFWSRVPIGWIALLLLRRQGDV
jgi:putative heme transporter